MMKPKERIKSCRCRVTKVAIPTRKVVNVVVNGFQRGIIFSLLPKVERACRKVFITHYRLPLRINRSEESVDCFGESIGVVIPPFSSNRSLKLLGDFSVVLVLAFRVGFLLSCGKLGVPYV